MAGAGVAHGPGLGGEAGAGGEGVGDVAGWRRTASGSGSQCLARHGRGRSSTRRGQRARCRRARPWRSEDGTAADPRVVTMLDTDVGARPRRAQWCLAALAGRGARRGRGRGSRAPGRRAEVLGDEAGRGARRGGAEEGGGAMGNGARARLLWKL